MIQNKNIQFNKREQNYRIITIFRDINDDAIIILPSKIKLYGMC